MDVEFENIENVNIRNEVFEVLAEMEVDFENIMGQESSNKNVQSNDTECLIGLNDGNMDHAEKFVQPSEINALNIRIRIKHCINVVIIQRMMIPQLYVHHV